MRPRLDDGSGPRVDRNGGRTNASACERRREKLTSTIGKRRPKAHPCVAETLHPPPRTQRCTYQPQPTVPPLPLPPTPTHHIHSYLTQQLVRLGTHPPLPGPLRHLLEGSQVQQPPEHPLRFLGRTPPRRLAPEPVLERLDVGEERERSIDVGGALQPAKRKRARARRCNEQTHGKQSVGSSAKSWARRQRSVITARKLPHRSRENRKHRTRQHERW